MSDSDGDVADGMPSQTQERFKEKTTRFIRAAAERSDAFRKMYFFDPVHEDVPIDTSRDLFLEKALTRSKGLVQKYPGRVLFMLSYTCAANCRYCERQDRVGVSLDAEGRLHDEDIVRAVDFIAANPDVYEVIFSGGDPLSNPRGLELACQLLAKVPTVKVLRIHTRYPVQVPDKIDFDLLGRIAAQRETFYLSIHIDHPDELTPETEAVIRRLRKQGFILLCQSVFLRGINDDYDTLKRLFGRLFELGVRPYYIYHCQPIPTTMRFVMDIADEVALMTRLREEMSGLAFPQHVVELQHTTGKLIAPTNHWNVDWRKIHDFTGNEYGLRDTTMKVQPPGGVPGKSGTA